MKTMLIILILINLLFLLYTRFKKTAPSYKEDFSPEEKEIIHNCLIESRRRQMLCGQDTENLLELIAKWEIVTGLDVPKEL